ncbi:MAG: hypothetical protein JNL62_20560 [Bryobacterales bacterium]|nr:hypothetical protein [Bryobacterales bacterium]
MTVLLLRWTLRRRFSGGLLARGRRFGFRHLGLVLWLIAGFLPFSVSVQFVGEAATLRTHPKTGDISVDLAYFALAGLLGVYQVAARRNWEIRERGVFVGGRYLPWVRMESFRWETPGEVTIQVRGLVTIRPKAVLRIAPERREEIDAYLGRQLSEWPS